MHNNPKSTLRLVLDAGMLQKREANGVKTSMEHQNL
jgi:hypothetical protein